MPNQYREILQNQGRNTISSINYHLPQTSTYSMVILYLHLTEGKLTTFIKEYVIDDLLRQAQGRAVMSRISPRNQFTEIKSSLYTIEDSMTMSPPKMSPRRKILDEVSLTNVSQHWAAYRLYLKGTVSRAGLGFR